jgi:hypothetical protein
MDELLSGLQPGEILHVFSDDSKDVSSCPEVSYHEALSIETSEKTRRISPGWNPESNSSTSFARKTYIHTRYTRITAGESRNKHYRGVRGQSSHGIERLKMTKALFASLAPSAPCVPEGAVGNS